MGVKNVAITDSKMAPNPKTRIQHGFFLAEGKGQVIAIDRAQQPLSAPNIDSTSLLMLLQRQLRVCAISGVSFLPWLEAHFLSS